MARALADIMTELNSVYNPQRTRQQDMYSQGMAAVDPMQSADLAGLEAAKKDSFNQIETGANRRGMFFSGIPLAEQAKYVGQNYLPSVANLQNRYATIKGNLYQTLAGALGNLDTEQRKFGQDIYGQEVNQDLQREQAAATARASAASAGSGFSPTYNAPVNNTPTPTAATPTLRQTWQQEAAAGDWNAQVALNYAGDDGNYDGLVNSQSEYDILKGMGITGNYYVGNGNGGLSGYTVPSGTTLQRQSSISSGLRGR